MYDVKTVSGIRKRKSKTFKPGVKKREAMEFKRQKEQEYEKSLGVLQIDITLSEFFDKYFIEYFKDTYSPTTLSNYKSAMYSSVLSLNSFFGKIPMSDSAFGSRICFQIAKPRTKIKDYKEQNTSFVSID